MAKTYIGMILAGSLAVTSFAGHHSNAKRMFSNLNWTASGAAGITHSKKDGNESTRTHNIAGYLGLATKGFDAHFSVNSDTNGNSNDQIMLDDMHVMGNQGALHWSLGRTNVRDGFGESTNAAANAYIFGGQSINSRLIDDAALANNFVSPSSYKRDVLSLGTKFNQFNVAAIVGDAKDGTNPKYDVTGINLGTAMHGFKMQMGFAKYDQDNDGATVNGKKDVTDLSVSTQAGPVSLMAAYNQSKGKDYAAATSNIKQKWFGLRASTKAMGKYTFTGQVERADTASATQTKKPRAISFSVETPLNATANIGLGYRQVTDATDVKTKTTALRVSAHI